MSDLFEDFFVTPTDDRVTGKASYIYLNGYVIPITSYSISSDRVMTDKTNSVHYNPNTRIFNPAQVAVAVSTSVQVEGRFRKSYIPTAILTQLYTDAGDVPVVLGLDAGSVMGHGNFDVTDFRTTVPINDVVTYSCTLMSNGTFYPFQ